MKCVVMRHWSAICRRSKSERSQLTVRSDLIQLWRRALRDAVGQTGLRMSGSSSEVMSAILKEDPRELPSSIPPALVCVVGRCLEKSPERRFQSAADLGFARCIRPQSHPPRHRKRLWQCRRGRGR